MPQLSPPFERFPHAQPLRIFDVVDVEVGIAPAVNADVGVSVLVIIREGGGGSLSKQPLNLPQQLRAL